jgi:Spherulation-specific family 4
MQQSLQQVVLAYFPPGKEWRTLISTTPRVALAVMNPDNGPGIASDTDYKDTVIATQKAGIDIAGYVYTGYGTVALQAVKEQIDRYCTWYNVIDIFLDCVANSTEMLEYYRSIYEFIQARPGTSRRTIINPGAQTAEEYMQACDIVCTCEMNASAYITHNAQNPAWMQEYPASRFWHIIYGIPNSSVASQVIATAKKQHIGFISLTEHDLPNPYGIMPLVSGWKDIANLLDSDVATDDIHPDALNANATQCG